LLRKSPLQRRVQLSLLLHDSSVLIKEAGSLILPNINPVLKALVALTKRNEGRR
jgi:hypothetical protein